jgi:hypothetical protein
VTQAFQVASSQSCEAIRHVPSAVRTEIRDSFVVVQQQGTGGLENVACLHTLTVRKIPLSRLHSAVPVTAIHRLQVKDAGNFVIFQVFTALIMKNVVWVIKTHFVRHRRHITSPLRVQLVNAM